VILLHISSILSR